MKSGSGLQPFALALLAQAGILVWLLSQPLYWAFHFEYALAANVLLFAVGGGGALFALSASEDDPGIPRAAGRILLSMALSLVFALAAQPLAGTCDAGEGLAWFALVPGVGSVLLLGEVLCLRALASSRRRMLALHTALVIGAALVMGARAYFGLSFRLYNLFLGYWPGVLYDEYVPIELPLLVTRGQALLLGIALVSLGLGILLRKHLARLAGVSLLALFALSLFAGARVGIHPWRESVAEDLGIVFQGRHVRWIADARNPRVERELPLLAARADYQAERVAKSLGIGAVPEMTVFLFASAEDKRRVIGAENTVVTRPWKHELYLHLSSRTHEVLRHELVHLLTADWAYPGLGISPNIAMLEGLAVSQEENLDGRFTGQGLARAVFEQKADFDLARFLSGAAFWSLSPQLAYPVAGAFVSFVQEPGVLSGDLREYYRTGKPAGQRLEDLAKAWRARLGAAPPPTDAERALARRVLAARPIFQKRCAHEVAECVHDARGSLWRGDTDVDGGTGAAMGILERALALDPNRADVRAFGMQLRISAGDLAAVQVALPGNPDEPPTYEQLAAAKLFAGHRLALGEYDAALPWLTYQLRWSSEVSDYWQAWVSRELARSGGAVSLERGDGAWALRCRLVPGSVSCTEGANFLDEGAEMASIVLFEDPEVEFAAAHDQYSRNLLTARPAEAEKWAARMAQVEGIGKTQRGRALEAEAEAAWLGGNLPTYVRKVNRGSE